MAKAGSQKYFGGEDVLKTYSFEGNILAAMYLQDSSFVSDSVTYCRWAFPSLTHGTPLTTWAMSPSGLRYWILSAVTAMELTENDVLKTVGERGWNLERLIMVREGRRRQHDQYNDAVFERNKASLDEKNFRTSMDHYYRTRDWDLEEGMPTRKKMEELGLTSVADELKTKYKVRVPA